MTRVLAVVVVGLAMMVMMVGIAACGASDQCSQGCSRMKSCGEKLNCATLDPLQQVDCNRSKQALLKLDCGPLEITCPSDVKARFEQAATCTLSPVTCECL